MLVRRLGLLGCLALSLVACGDDGGGDEGAAGQLGQPCLGGSFCNEGLVCVAGVCMSDGADEAEDDADTSEDEDSSGPGESDSTSESETDTTTTTTGSETIPLYGGPCTASDECEGDGWCTESWGFCSMPCMDDVDCPAHPTATATPNCTGLFSEVGGNAMLGCALECDDVSDCPPGTQCRTVGVQTWCTY
ncbi:MAG: hypothetical protein HC927_04550 [Deltaproteobacteria bacterium]|nr:hypothetical protein [Deltaproteobacteria bacterium]